jgi:hypothetical protein
MATKARHTDIRNAPGHYGRPVYKLSYYSQQINARAIATFETRAEAVGFMAVGQREGWMEKPAISHEATHF